MTFQGSRWYPFEQETYRGFLHVVKILACAGSRVLHGHVGHLNASPVQVWCPRINSAEDAALFVRYPGRIKVGCVGRGVQQPPLFTVQLGHLAAHKKTSVATVLPKEVLLMHVRSNSKPN